MKSMPMTSVSSFFHGSKLLSQSVIIEFACKNDIYWPIMEGISSLDNIPYSIFSRVNPFPSQGIAA